MARLRPVALAGLLAAACVPASAGATVIPPSAVNALALGPQTIALPTALPYVYAPASIAVAPGVLSWSGALASHPLAFEDGAPGSSSGTLFQRDVRPGVVRFYCRIHGGPGGSGMAGVAYVAGPAAALSATPASRTTPGPVTLDASATDFVDLTPNTTATYAFDADGDGTFETSGASPTVQATFPLGTRTARVRVTDDDGRTGEATVSVRVGDTPAPGPSGDGPGGSAGDGVDPADRVAPALRAAATPRVRRRPLLRGPVSLKLGTLSERATVKASLRLHGKTIGRAGARSVAAGTLRVTVRLTPAGRRTVRGLRTATLTLRLELTDAVGNRRVISRAVHLRR